MAEYIERDPKRLKRLRQEAQQFQDDIVCAVGTDFMQTIAEAENRMIFDILKGLQDAPAADVVEVRRRNLRVEINTDCFGDTELAKERGWYRKFFYCPDCGLLLRTESWDERYMFGSGTVLKTNDMPNYCPNCGAKLDGKGDGE